MLQHISWMNYWISVFLLSSGYYLYVNFFFYKKDLSKVFNRISGKGNVISPEKRGDLPFTATDVMGKVQPDDVASHLAEDIVFAPAEGEQPEIPETEQAFNEMRAEIRTMIIAVQQSGSSSESFFMLFRLLTEKYEVLQGTEFQDQINTLALFAARQELSLDLNQDKLNNHWIKSN